MAVAVEVEVKEEEEEEESGLETADSGMITACTPRTFTFQGRRERPR